MPFAVSTGGGPVSGKELSKRPARLASTSTGSPCASSTGFQWMRSSEMARRMTPSPQYTVFAADSGCDQASAFDLRHNPRRFVGEGRILALRAQRGTVLRPVNQVFRGGDGSVGLLPIPLRVRHHIGAIRAFHNTWVFAAARPLPLLLGIVIGVENRLRPASEVDAVAAFGEAQSRSV